MLTPASTGTYVPVRTGTRTVQVQVRYILVRTGTVKVRPYSTSIVQVLYEYRYSTSSLQSDSYDNDSVVHKYYNQYTVRTVLQVLQTTVFGLFFV